MRMKRRTAAPLLLLAMLVSACGGGGGTSTPSSSPRPADPRDELRAAKVVVDSAPSLHFKITSRGNVPTSDPEITSGEGDATRSNSGFTGTFQVALNGLDVEVSALSVEHVFYARLILGGWQKADPKNYGFGDPAMLLDPTTGLSNLLVTTLAASYGPADRLAGTGESLEEISTTVPGKEVAALLVSADPSKDVTAVFGISVSTHQLRQVVLTGPFWSAKTNSTYTVVVTGYGEHVQITPPA